MSLLDKIGKASSLALVAGLSFMQGCETTGKRIYVREGITEEEEKRLIKAATEEDYDYGELILNSAGLIIGMKGAERNDPGLYFAGDKLIDIGSRDKGTTVNINNAPQENNNYSNQKLRRIVDNIDSGSDIQFGHFVDVNGDGKIDIEGVDYFNLNDLGVFYSNSEVIIAVNQIKYGGKKIRLDFYRLTGNGEEIYGGERFIPSPTSNPEAVAQFYNISYFDAETLRRDIPKQKDVEIFNMHIVEADSLHPSAVKRMEFRFAERFPGSK